MKILDLPLKKEWYNMIESGIKKEEYREIKPYWEKRLLDYNGIKRDYKLLFFRNVLTGIHHDLCKEYKRGYDAVRFRYGYTKKTMTFKIESIFMGMGKTEWGAPADKQVFIISFGEKLNYSKL
jgi:hypothetical protein